jgi:hypothetical protein
LGPMRPTPNFLHELTEVAFLSVSHHLSFRYLLAQRSRANR